MSSLPLPTHQPSPAPQAFRDALAELVQLGLSVARMVGRIAEAETALAEAAAQASVAEGVSPMAGSLAEAIEADRAAAAAAEARQTVAARTEMVAGAFARAARSVRLTVMLAERLERGWARPVADDRHAMARRQIVRGVEDAIAREAEGERAERLSAALAERLESAEVERELGSRPVDEIMQEICRGLGLDPVRMVVRPPVPGAGGEIAAAAGGWSEGPLVWRPDG